MTDSSFLPSDLGLPPKFSRYYPGQEKAILHLASDDHRVSILNAPTGSGKSPIVISVSSLLDTRTLILVPSKALQAQYERDFSSMGLYNIEGHSNYECATSSHNRETGEYDFECRWKEECLYKEAVEQANASRLVLTNVAHWVHLKRRDPDRLGQFDLLVVDEAHNAERLLCDYVSERLSERSVNSILGIPFPSNYPNSETSTTSLSLWLSWLQSTRDACRDLYRHLAKTYPDSAQLDDCKKLGLQIALIIDKLESEKWKVNPEQGFRGLRVSPVWAHDYVESHLFRGIPRIILTSATMPETAAKYLALTKKDYSYYEMPSTFPSQNRPILYYPSVSSVRVDNRMGDGEQRLWLNRIDSILTARPDVKGIIQTVSYDRARYLKEHSQHADRILIHRSGQTRNAVREYKSSRLPLILASPAIEEGFDFPDDECRLLIIAKLPFVYSGDPIISARLKEDKTYSNYLTALRLTQMPGRGVRSPTDWCEIFIVDSHWEWFRKQPHFPGWLRQAFQWVEKMPEKLVPVESNASTRGIIRRRSVA